MKIFLVFVLVAGMTLIAAYLLGWKNLGNQPPVVPQKLLAQQSVKPAAEPETNGDPRADTSCANILQAVQNQTAIDSEIGWLAGYIAARNTDSLIPADKLTKEELRTQLLAVCAEFQPETLKQAAERVIAKLRS